MVKEINGEAFLITSCIAIKLDEIASVARNAVGVVRVIYGNDRVRYIRGQEAEEVWAYFTGTDY